MPVIGPDPNIDFDESGSNSDATSQGVFGRAWGGFTNRIGRLLTVPKGGIRVEPRQTTVNIQSKFSKQGKDLRARLKVPKEYLERRSEDPGPIYDKFQGILFPYTPTINFEVKADYTTQNPIHSNFAQYFYQRSSVSGINLNAKFTVQNQKDAEYYLTALMLLRALTKMQVGGDPRAGSPPPICRLSAYGPFMLENVPVAVQSLRVELPDTVDYWTLGKESNYLYGTNSVPTLSTLSLSLIPIYSRDEMYRFSVDQFLKQGAESEFRKKGYL